VANGFDEKNHKLVNYFSELRDRLISIESKIDSFTHRYDQNFLEFQERLIHVEEKIDYILQRQHQAPARKIAYLHVPKSGGTSLTNALIEAVMPRYPIGGADRLLYGNFNDFLSFPAEERQYIYQQPEHISPFADFLAGHFSLSTILGWDPTASIVLILREPQCRLLSHWTFWRSEGDSENHEIPLDWRNYIKLAYSDFYDFLANPKLAAQTDNVATRLLLWPHPLIPTESFISPRHDKKILEMVRFRLHKLSHINILENKHLTADLGRWLGRSVDPKRMKVTNPVKDILKINLDDQLNKKTTAAWRARSRLDKVLWREVANTVAPLTNLELFEEEIIEANIQHHKNLLSGSNPPCD